MIQSVNNIPLHCTQARELLSHNEVIPCTISDHDAIFCTRKIKKEKQPSKTIKCRDYSNYNHEAMQKELKETDFSSVYSEKNPKKAWNSLKSILTNVFDNYAPVISKRVKGKTSSWLARDIKKEMNDRDKLHRKFRKSRSDLDSQSYKKQRNKVNIMVRKAKSNYYRNLLTESSRDPKRFWNTLKRIFPTKKYEIFLH